ncbi:MAG: TniQ family protein [Legionella sp.]|uniref:TniQ family protein n=1 Tax=Legionella sp. TaxID=459 RepID=UPI0039E5035C
MQTRWPLHPKPRPYETLEKYVRRLAECYGVGYENFCLRALNISSNDSKARQFREPTPELLQRLSHGTGIAIEVLEQMTLECIWDRLMKEATEMLNI